MNASVVVTCPGCGSDACGSWSDCMSSRRFAANENQPCSSQTVCEKNTNKSVQCRRLERRLRILLSPRRSSNSKDAEANEEEKHAENDELDAKTFIVDMEPEEPKTANLGYLKILLSQKSRDEESSASPQYKHLDDSFRMGRRGEKGDKVEEGSNGDTVRFKVECCGKEGCHDDDVLCCLSEISEQGGGIEDGVDSEEILTDTEYKSPDSVLMKLHLVVLETRQQWKRALIRMVLDPGKVDYGTLSVAVPTGNDTMKGQQETMYQRQPLLPNQGSLVLTIDDSDEDADGLQSLQTLPRQNGRVVNIKLPPPLKEEPRFPKEIFKTFLAFLFMALSMTLGILVLSIVHDRVPNLDVAERNISKPLPDIVLDNVPTNDTWALNASEIIIMISFYCCAIIIFLHKYRYIVARRAFLIMGLLYLLRCITMCVTVLPVSSYTYKCSPREPHPNLLLYIKRTWQLLTGMGLSINGKHTFCGDFIYSGHTTILVMAYLIISEYSPRKLYPLHWLSWCLSVFGVICVLLSRGHYTIDVVLAYYVTTRIFWIYHTLACNVKLKEWGPNNYISRVWWFPIFRYFEGNILAPVPRQYDWPLPWPRRFLSRRTNRDS